MKTEKHEILVCFTIKRYENNLYTITAVTVKPADVEPIPVVKTDRGTTFDAKCKSCDFPVPGSPTNSKCGCDLAVIVLSFSLS